MKHKVIKGQRLHSVKYLKNVWSSETKKIGNIMELLNEDQDKT